MAMCYQKHPFGLESEDRLTTINTKIFEIKKKIQLSEGQRKSNYEENEAEKQQNANLIETLKREITERTKELAEAKALIGEEEVRIKKYLNDICPVANKTPDQIIHHLDLKVIELRKNIDLLKYERRKKKTRLKDLEKEYEQLLLDNSRTNIERIKSSNPSKKRASHLENEIHKVTVQWNEAELVKKKYTTIRQSLLDDSVKFGSSLEQIEALLRSQTEEIKKLEMVKAEAIEMRARATSALNCESSRAADADRVREQERAYFNHCFEERERELEMLQKRIFPPARKYCIDSEAIEMRAWATSTLNCESSRAADADRVREQERTYFTHCFEERERELEMLQKRIFPPARKYCIDSEAIEMRAWATSTLNCESSRAADADRVREQERTYFTHCFEERERELEMLQKRIFPPARKYCIDSEAIEMRAWATSTLNCESSRAADADRVREQERTYFTHCFEERERELEMLQKWIFPPARKYCIDSEAIEMRAWATSTLNCESSRAADADRVREQERTYFTHCFEERERELEMLQKRIFPPARKYCIDSEAIEMRAWATSTLNCESSRAADADRVREQERTYFTHCFEERERELEMLQKRIFPPARKYCIDSEAIEMRAWATSTLNCESSRAADADRVREQERTYFTHCFEERERELEMLQKRIFPPARKYCIDSEAIEMRAWATSTLNCESSRAADADRVREQERTYFNHCFEERERELEMLQKRIFPPARKYCIDSEAIEMRAWATSTLNCESSRAADADRVREQERTYFTHCFEERERELEMLQKRIFPPARKYCIDSEAIEMRAWATSTLNCESSRAADADRVREQERTYFTHCFEERERELEMLQKWIFPPARKYCIDSEAIEMRAWATSTLNCESSRAADADRVREQERTYFNHCFEERERELEMLQKWIFPPARKYCIDSEAIEMRAWATSTLNCESSRAADADRVREQERTYFNHCFEERERELEMLQKWIFPPARKYCIDSEAIEMRAWATSTLNCESSRAADADRVREQERTYFNHCFEERERELEMLQKWIFPPARKYCIDSEAIEMRAWATSTLNCESSRAADADRVREQERTYFNHCFEERERELEMLQKWIFPPAPRQVVRQDSAGSGDQAAVAEETSPTNVVNVVEEIFQRLMKLTGATEPEQVLERWTAQRETGSRLQQLQQSTEQEKLALEGKQSTLLNQLERYKLLQLANKDEVSEQIDDLKKSISEESEKHEAILGKLNETNGLLVDVKTLLYDLCTLLDVVGKPEIPEWTFEPRDVVEIVEVLKARFSSASERHQDILLRSQDMGLPVPSAAAVESAKASLTGASTPRTKDTAREDEAKTLTYKELVRTEPVKGPVSDEDDDIPSRSYLKRQAQIIVDTKSRRKGYRVPYPRK